VTHTHERRPLSETPARAGRPAPSLPVRYVSPPLDTMAPRAQAIWLEAYQLGYEHGIAEGIRQADDADAAAWRRICLPIGPDYADLAERRGETERAARQRQIVRDRGLAS
jgi:hypothetical protein